MISNLSIPRHQRCLFTRVLGVGLALALASSTAHPTMAESWTSLNGDKTLDATLVGVWENSAVMKTPTGRRIVVSLDALDTESRIRARKRAEELKQSRATRIAELNTQADQASAPAPNPIPSAPQPPSYIPVPADLDAVASRQHLMAQGKAGHILTSFDSLPPSYRRDVEEVVKAAVAKVDPQSVDTMLTLVSELGDLVVTRQRWLFEHPRFLALNETTQDKLKSVILPLAGLLREGFHPDSVNWSEIQKQPFRQWLQNLDDAMAPRMYELMQNTGDLVLAPEFETSREKDDFVSLKTTVGEQSVTENLMKVEGFWVNADLAKVWSKGKEDALVSLAAIPDGSLGSQAAMMVPGMLAPLMQPLRDAETSADFHVALNQIGGQLAMLGPMIKSNLPPGVDVMSLAGGPPSRGRNSGGYGGGDEYGGDDGGYGGGYGDDGGGYGDEEGMEEGEGPDYGGYGN
ncbi:MAG: hypothetical protein AAGA03_01620 [Planctomycetota bacterium]